MAPPHHSQGCCKPQMRLHAALLNGITVLTHWPATNDDMSKIEQ